MFWVDRRLSLVKVYSILPQSKRELTLKQFTSKNKDVACEIPFSTISTEL